MAGWSLVVPQREIDQVPTTRVFGGPHPALAAHVHTYTAHDFVQPESMSWLMAPLGAVLVVLELDSPHWTLESPVFGLRDTPFRLDTPAGRSRAITIGLTPLGAVALFGPLRDLANTTVPLETLLGRRVGLLTEQLSEAPDWPTRFTLLDTHLATWFTHALPRELHGAWHRITTTGGQIRIDSLAEELGWTRQHLRTRFQAHIGLPPKTIARIARLHRATTLLTAKEPLSRSTIATLCGYADQSHLNRDFRALTGSTPTEIA
ncbi:helix-turn-helix transcriptional regulator [Actinokineospora sp. NBRC 105648]|uniref:helix-turn-helix transcriptional regulator n=1 Tax=Actinokineospora sp. NBRC 105648 TaxID=3032206 RepID=UPI0024A46BC7|nr:helix-turn-helix transcriptional regulator [Actinokineospora sp. NBRC 105648]GLZ39235.1 hypothetical protein Acsp05_28590 [Actinokineospora sp. NBRC 105648]